MFFVVEWVALSAERVRLAILCSDGAHMAWKKVGKLLLHDSLA
jgi:hypothetical protein